MTTFKESSAAVDERIAQIQQSERSGKEQALITFDFMHDPQRRLHPGVYRETAQLAPDATLISLRRKGQVTPSQSQSQDARTMGRTLS
ncbi:hypothetical protein SAMN04488038_102287 [Solimonas aquatica]|uniref:Uncharacterized protein n=1 Tax=Solimonas aquatica TaxID=489703 RepID=A0A1H9BZH6_9GAMM|nr:hypothetical protein [Solimonas aquatica]SEP94167.1 hypothetical protein SAMN04488038_102287 [Solimonas aquatica]